MKSPTVLQRFNVKLGILFLLFSGSLVAQITISGKVTDNKGKPIAGANVFIEGSYDGATTDPMGDFSFSTNEKGIQTLLINSLLYETLKISGESSTFQNQIFKLKQSANALDTVVISAGTLESGDKARVSVLKPLDIVTTAGSAGNIIAALQTLPGTQNVGEDGRLFVRGGEANETQTFVDGIRVAQPYGASVNNVPTRGRFSPFLFSGISFSTGGYSAEYGEALSSVLLLNTISEPDQNKTDISFMTVGLGIGNAQKWKKSSFSINTSYINLAPYQAAIPQNADWNSPFQSLSGETVYRYNFKNGILKVYAAFDSTKFDINQENINLENKVRVDLNNNNFYFNTSYKGTFGSNWQLTTGMSYGLSKNKVKLDFDTVNSDENAAHLKFKIKKSISNYFKLSFGGDYFITQFKESFKAFNSGKNELDYNSAISAVFAEGDFLVNKNFALKLGLRASYNDLLDETAISPRASLAYKVSKNSQFSLACGNFNQMPIVDYIKFSKFHTFKSEKAIHYILNYQFSKDSRTFRAEAYYKDYSNLVQYDTTNPVFNSNYSNNGSGFAKGLDLFWRDGKSIRNLEYWVSYSYIDTEREYRNFPKQATPSFVSDHSLSVVTKYFITDWKSQIGFTHSTATGRPYNNPNETQFMNGKTKAYNNLSFNWAYLLSQQKILCFSVSNVLGTQNVFGYEYANKPNGNGVFNRREIIPTADRFFFVGFFWTISENKKDNQLNNLQALLIFFKIFSILKRIQYYSC